MSNNLSFPSDFQGHFFGHYHVDTIPYVGEDTSKKCFVFAGQGSVKPGMLADYYESSAIIQNRFAIANQLATQHHLQPVSDYIVNPKSIPKEQVIITRILCLLTLEIGIYEHLRAINLKPSVLAGHSFGDFPMLWAAGVIDFETLFALVIHREKNSPPEHSIGYLMVAYAGHEAVLAALPNTSYTIANINSPTETAIAVDKQDAKKLKAAFRAKDIKTNILRSVPHPYHSDRMAGLSQAMLNGIQQHNPQFSTPTIPFYSCTLNKLITPNNFKDSDAIKIITQNVINPVNFVELARQVYQSGIRHFIEIGPTPVCSAFISNTIDSNTLKSQFATQWLKKERSKTRELLDEKSNAILSSINKAIGKITGYEIEQIAIEDKYQEELGIDSLKKVEIIVSVLEDFDIAGNQSVSISDFETIEDTIEFIRNSQCGARGAKPSQKRATHFKRMIPTWVPQQPEFFFTHTHSSLPTSSTLPILQAQDIEDRLDFAHDFYQNNWLNNMNKALILRTESLFAHQDIFRLDTFKETANQTIRPIWGFLQTLLTLCREDQKAIYVTSTLAPNPMVEAIFGYLRAAAKEQDNLTVKLLEFSEAPDSQRLKHCVEMEQVSHAQHVRYNGNERYVQQLNEAPVKTAMPLREGAVIVAIGGAKGICFSLLAAIVQQNPSVHLLIAGRSDPKNDLIQSNLNTLKANTNNTVEYQPLDATQPDQVMNYMSDIIERYGDIDLLLNGAGLIKVSMLQDKNPTDFDQEFFSKSQSAFNCLTAAKEFPIHQTITFSSVLGLFGGAGQTLYCAANAMINTMVSEFNEQEADKRAVSLCWPPWDNTGMTENRLVKKQLNDLGLSLLSESDAINLFRAELINSAGNLYYFDSADHSRYATPARSLNELMPLIGNGKSRSKSNVQHSFTFNKQYNLKHCDSYLNEHRVADMPCVPAATMIMQFYAAARLHFGSSVALNNVEILSPILVKDTFNTDINGNIDADANLQNKHSQLSLTVESSLLHAKANATCMNEQPTEALKLPSKVSSIDIATRYHHSNAFKHVFHGKRFKLLSSAYLDHQENPTFSLNLKSAHPLFSESDDSMLAKYSQQILLIDNAFQALGMLIKHSHSLNTLPTAVKHLVFYSEPQSASLSDTVHLFPLITNHQQDDCEGDVTLFNDLGIPLIALRGVKMSNATHGDSTTAKKPSKRPWRLF